MNMFRKIAACLMLGSSLACVPSVLAQQEAPIAPASATGTAATPTWTSEQLITSTVHDAWVMSGKNEATFFEMVRTLAEISAKNRGITLPDDATVGRKLGEHIKRQAKKDTDQLLYVVVDTAVTKTLGKPAAPAPATK